MRNKSKSRSNNRKVGWRGLKDGREFWEFNFFVRELNFECSTIMIFWLFWKTGVLYQSRPFWE